MAELIYGLVLLMDCPDMPIGGRACLRT